MQIDSHMRNKTQPEHWGMEHTPLRIRMDKLVLGGILLECFVIRLFTNKLNLLPGWANYLDYPILILYAVYVFVNVWRHPIPKRRTGFGWLTLALVVIVYASALINLKRLHPGAVTLFVVDLFEPLAFMFLTYILSPDREVTDFLVKLLWGVGFLQIIIFFGMDLPKFLDTHNPDVISGSFGGNAYQMVFVLLVWNALILGRPSRRHPIWYGVGVALLQVLILVIILLAQYRAIIPFAVPTWGLTYLTVSKRSSRVDILYFVYSE